MGKKNKRIGTVYSTNPDYEYQSEEEEMELKDQPVLKSKTTVVKSSESSSTDQATSSNKSDALKPAANTAGEKKEVQDDEESVLTFNFLYYIIQKFKFAEVIDQ